MAMEEWLTVAKIVKPQGIRGEVKVITLTDYPEDIQAFGRVYIDGKCHKVLKVRPLAGDSAIVALSGIADRNAAELLRGKELLAAREDAPELPENTFYIVDVIGCRAVTEEGKPLGTVTDITPARTDIYEVTEDDGKKFAFVAADGVILNVDVAAKVVTVSGKRLQEVAVDR